ncbi:hypothetical protein E8E13_003650 [Curvularia kusanoi]|uniref:B30.2/SPRY domain-containing protein n=1 Tax=Curvularia kusanoi TaxID=90978 RepID=A0A9P4W2Z1_CURKU|nr:hypothetical protein E8E13_003650 [Curvularia kusanoi]
MNISVRSFSLAHQPDELTTTFQSPRIDNSSAVLMTLSSSVADSEKQAEFALDLFSDIAPLLALFGDEFAKQFASESLTWVDHLISAMVPLGILTTIRGAIRVQGPRIVRSFIGRGRETRALAEIELMSSTSKEVCELFNGKSIIRAIGKPKIAQILVFPEEYNRLQRKYNDEASGSGSAEMDRSCGIHTLETAMAADPNLPPQRTFEMKCDPYHSKSYMFMEELVKGGRELLRSSTTKLLRSSTTKLSGLRKPKGAADPEKAESGTPQPNSSAPESTKASKQQSGPSSKRSDTKAEGTDFKLPGPPNLQLGLSSDQFETRSIKKRHEIFAAAVIAVILQLGASATLSRRVLGPAEQHVEPVAKRESNLSRVTKPEHQKAKDNFTWKDILECLKHLYSLTKQDDVKWKGYTVCGAVAAGAGFIAQLIGLRGLAYPCSIAHLLAVILMAFVRAMIRRRLGHVPIHRVAFSRYEIDYLATQLVHSRDFREQTGDFSSKDSTNKNKKDTEHVLRWKVKTAIKPAGPATSDVPNVTEPLETPSQQTPTPAMVSKDDSSCQQLLQISATVSKNGSSCQQLLRVRERLGDLCEWQSTALEAAKSLALSIEAFMDTFFDLNKGGNSEIQPDWFVETVGLSSNEGVNQGNFIHIPIQKSKTGNKWQTNVGIIEAILSLWMATIESTTKADKKKAKAKQNQAADASESSQGSSNWRYKKSGIDLRYKFCRIIGDAYDDDVLNRDLSWWVDELIADQSDGCYKAENEEPSWHHSNARTDMDLIIGFNSSQNHLDSSGRKPCDPRTRELAISDANALSTILAQHLFTSFMWTVVEKLPRDFLRRGSENNEQLVNIEGRRAFDPRDFEKTWYCPTLRHRKLTKLVREIEKSGLGSYTDILLCMIPAFSSKDLLPNHAMLKLIPPVQHDHGWVATAGDYTRLLRTSIQTSPPEMLCYNVIVAVMDFLYLAYEPYDSFVKPHDDLMDALQDLTNELFTVKFEPILKEMVPLYSTQQRWKRFEEIFFLCGSEQDRIRDKALPEIKKSAESAVSVFESFDQASLATRLGFCPTFKGLYKFLERKATGFQGQVTIGMLRPFRWYQFNEGDSLDIFGWSPWHYAALVDYEALADDDYWFHRRASPFSRTKKLQIHRILDNIQRSPVHVAVAAGNTIAFRDILANIADEDKGTTLNASGLDQMNTLHLAAQCGSQRIVAMILEQTPRQPLTHSDFWGRGAIHIAASYGHDKICQKLLANGADPHSIDLIGKAPLDYVLKGDAPFKDAGDPMEKQEAIKPNEGDRSADHKLFTGGPHLPAADDRAVGETEMDKKQKHSDPLATNLAGRTALHVAVEEGKNDVAEYLLNLRPLQGNSKDEEGAITECWPSDVNYCDPNFDQSPLSWACERGHQDIVEELLKCADIDVNKPASQYENLTPLHFAARADVTKTVKLLLDDPRTDIDAKKHLCPILESIAKVAWSFWNNDALQSMVKEQLGDKVILKLFEMSESLRDTVLWPAFARRALECGITRIEVKPGIAHMPARLNDIELMRNLCSKISKDVIKSQSVDEDGWTCIEYANTYRSEPLGKEMEQLAQEFTDLQHVHTMPSCLEMEQVKTAVLHKECTRTGHSKCIGIHVIEVDKDARTDEQEMPTLALLRTTKCVPPPSSRTVIYHEIKILEEGVPHTMIAIGFCNRQYGRDRMLGWQGHSFGYHNDDGKLFVNWYEEHGTRLELSRYHVGDTAGVGLNLETGEGFVTLNGKLLETNEAFAHDYNKFNNKKMYPCVGYDNEESGVGLKFEWNLGGSLDTHPFVYKDLHK